MSSRLGVYQTRGSSNVNKFMSSSSSSHSSSSGCQKSSSTGSGGMDNPYDGTLEVADLLLRSKTERDNAENGTHLMEYINTTGASIDNLRSGVAYLSTIVEQQVRFTKTYTVIEFWKYSWTTFHYCAMDGLVDQKEVDTLVNNKATVSFTTVDGIATFTIVGSGVFRSRVTQKDTIYCRLNGTVPYAQAPVTCNISYDKFVSRNELDGYVTHEEAGVNFQRLEDQNAEVMQSHTNTNDYLDFFMTLVGPTYFVGSVTSDVIVASQSIINSFTSLNDIPDTNITVTSIHKLGTVSSYPDTWKQPISFNNESFIGKSLFFKDVPGHERDVVVDNFQLLGESYLVIRPSYTREEGSVTVEKIPINTLVNVSGTSFSPVKFEYDPASYRVYKGSHIELKLYQAEWTGIEADTNVEKFMFSVHNSKSKYVRFSGDLNDRVFPVMQMYRNENLEYCLALPISVENDLTKVNETVTSLQTTRFPITIRCLEETTDLKYWNAVEMARFNFLAMLDPITGVQYITVYYPGMDQNGDEMVGMQLKINNPSGTTLTILSHDSSDSVGGTLAQRYVVGGVVPIDAKTPADTLTIVRSLILAGQIA